MATPFRAVIVDRLTEGPTTIFWDLVTGFKDAGPYRFRVQAGSTGNPFADDWADVGAEVVNTYFTIDTVKRDRAKAITTHYRVILSTADRTYVSGPVPATQWLDRHQFRVAREMLRRNRRAMERSPYRREGYLLLRRRFGESCPRCILDPITHQSTDPMCPVCYGTSILGGYFAPLPYQFAMITPRVITERIHSGEPRPADDFRKGTFLGYPTLQTYDIFVDAHSDERFACGRITQAETVGSVVIVYDIELGVIDFSDVIYTFPIPTRSGPY